MKKLFIVAFFVMASLPVSAKESKTDFMELGQNYFDAMVASQAPNATSKDLEKFLALLTDDVGSTHLPYVTDDSRLPNGKEDMRQGMTFYLGSHTEFNAELLDMFIFNSSAIAIRYKKSAKGIHPQTKQPIAYSQTQMDILEIENGKIAIIRKYHE